MAKYRNDRNNPPRSSRGTRTGMSTRTMENRGDRPREEGEQGPQGHRRTEMTQAMGSLGQDTGSLARQALSSPFSFMRRFSEEMDRLFEDFGFGRGWMSPSMGEMSPSGFRELGRAAWTPQVEVFRRGDELVVRCDLPGMRKEDVRVDIQQDQLVLQGERTWQNENDREGVMRSERHYGSFYRVIPLPEGVRAEDARAAYKDGVLEISLPAPEERPRGHRVQID
ncbi:MAG TPA: Hsp20/alpha crystallin family protein [Candidatus Polarisedimenticolaceae bacterium]|nr:Hsp20/alpha crystallin family protein [Candidatus Polarisedimenticolaceae bacterium]